MVKDVDEPKPSSRSLLAAVSPRGVEGKGGGVEVRLQSSGVVYAGLSIPVHKLT